MYKKFLAVDPGINGLGLAYFDTNLLVSARYVPNDKKTLLPERIFALDLPDAWHCRVIELPKVYTASLQKGDPNDLIKLALVVGRLTTANTVYLLPQDWKGQAPKEAVHERVFLRLSETEKGAIEPCPKSLLHNVFDAIGIGLHYLGRLAKERIYAR